MPAAARGADNSCTRAPELSGTGGLRGEKHESTKTYLVGLNGSLSGVRSNVRM